MILCNEQIQDSAVNLNWILVGTVSRVFFSSSFFSFFFFFSFLTPMVDDISTPYYMLFPPSFSFKKIPGALTMNRDYGRPGLESETLS